ncbi:MAG: IS1634 family transposase [Acidobacteriota bacterium]|nr:IS1634 family transposase [Acidobacteriota bacterium]
MVEALNKLLKGEEIAELSNITELKQYQGKSYGGLKVVHEIAGEMGIIKALGNSKKAKIVLMIIAGIILSRKKSKHYISEYWSRNQAIEGILKIMDYYNEDALYDSLDWLQENQLKIEKKLWSLKEEDYPSPRLFLYDVTSSYVEGEHMDLTAYGYNRDGKKNKKQIVIGLLTDKKGSPVSIEVFAGNTLDYQTVSGQLEKIEKEFGVNEVVYVGDRGMIKSKQIEDIDSRKWKYITGITKPQIRKLLKDDVFQYGLFDEDLCEVKEKGIRYILRRNPYRANEIKANLEGKLQSLRDKVRKKNEYLSVSERRSAKIGLKNVNKYLEKLRLKKLVDLKVKDRRIIMEIDQEEMDEIMKLAGCYVLKTNVTAESMKKEEVHERYRDLSKVERDFRILKTDFLDIRPIFVRKESRIRGHVFACMLALKIVRYVERKTKKLKKPMVYIWECLNSVKYVINEFKGETFKTLPKISNDTTKSVLKALDITFPSKL